MRQNEEMRGGLRTARLQTHTSQSPKKAIPKKFSSSRIIRGHSRFSRHTVVLSLFQLSSFRTARTPKEAHAREKVRPISRMHESIKLFCSHFSSTRQRVCVYKKESIQEKKGQSSLTLQQSERERVRERETDRPYSTRERTNEAPNLGRGAGVASEGGEIKMFFCTIQDVERSIDGALGRGGREKKGRDEARRPFAGTVRPIQRATCLRRRTVVFLTLVRNDRGRRRSPAKRPNATCG